MDKLDFKKVYRDLYLPSERAAVVDLPEMGFFAVEGAGAPECAAYQNGVSALYALTFTVKMSARSGWAIDGYFEYVVPPLEGVWEADGPRERWQWTSMIRQPDFVTEAVAAEALDIARRKKSGIDFSAARFVRLQEGKCVQVLHVGPYDDEARSFDKLAALCEAQGLVRSGNTHREIYLSDPRKTPLARLKTVLRWQAEG